MFAEEIKRMVDNANVSHRHGGELAYLVGAQIGTRLKTEEDHYLLQIDMPGVKKEDVQIGFVKDFLNVQWAREGDPNSDREFTMPKDVDRENIAASMADGVLSLQLLRKKEPAPTLIPIQ